MELDLALGTNSISSAEAALEDTLSEVFNGSELRRLVSDNPFGMCIADLEGGFSYLNSAARAILGFSAEDVRAGVVRWDVLTPTEFLKQDQHAVEQILKTGRALPYEKELLAKNGERVPLLIASVTLPNADGAKQVATYLVDLREQRKVQKELEELRTYAERQWAELESLYSTAPVGLAIIDAHDYTYLRLNCVQSEMIGVPTEEILGRTVRSFGPQIADMVEGHFRQAAGGSPVRDILLEGELNATPGVHRSWLINYYPLQQPNGTINAITCVTQEITKQKQAERALLQSEKLAAVGRLASSISHEINNPLASITNLLFLARNAPGLPLEIAEYLDVADRELRRVSALTTQTLRFYKQATSPTACKATDLFRETLSVYQGRIVNARIKVEERHRLNASVECFEGEIRQVLSSLVSNAIDAMPSGGRLILRSCKATDPRTGHQGIRLTVADSGFGMPAPVQRKAFEAFFTTKGIGGTGLGLWISEEIVARHHGSLRLRSSQKEGFSGTVLTLFLPSEAANR